MTQWTRWRHCFRAAMLVVLVLTIAVPTASVRVAADDVAMAVQAQLPQGDTVTYTQIADIGGDGQRQAIFKAEGAGTINPLIAESVGIAVLQGGNWQIVNQSMRYPDVGTAAEIYVYPKNDQHPGFVIANQHLCGANCNGGVYRLLQYGGGTFSAALSGTNDRGALSADPITGVVTLTGPVYAHADPRCCPEFRYTRSWAWQGGTLAPGALTFAAAPDKTLPTWVVNDGARLVTSLNGFVAPPAINERLDATAIIASLADRVQVKDAANNDCVASKSAVAAALAQGIAPGTGAIWPAMDGYSFALNWDARSFPNGVMADGCTLDAGNGGGYVLHLTPTATGFVGDRLYATPQIFTNIPSDAIQLPPM